MEMVEEIRSLEAKENVIYLFSLNNEIDANEEKLLIENISPVNVKPIPSKMYEIYKKVIEDLKRDY